MYDRILLKLSGEQLQGKFDSGFDAERAAWIAKETAKITALGSQVVIMIGGGNYARGAQLAHGGVKRVSADNIGMLATMMNSIMLSDAFCRAGLKTKVMSAVDMPRISEIFDKEKALRSLNKTLFNK